MVSLRAKKPANQAAAGSVCDRDYFGLLVISRRINWPFRKGPSRRFRMQKDLRRATAQEEG